MVVRTEGRRGARDRLGTARVRLLAPLLLMTHTSPACAELELLLEGSGGGPGPPPSDSLSVSFIDVGQGDGVLVQAGAESYLLDAGRPEEGPNVVDFLRSRGVEELDGIVVSNPDADHIGGFLDVFDAFRVERVYVSGDPNNTLTYEAFLRGVDDEGARTEVLRAGMVMDWGGVRADARVSKHPILGLRFRALQTEDGYGRVRLHSV
jgi:beta-lactamase superfamily II metal-dependent hydrolase